MSDTMNFEQLVALCKQTHEEIQKRAVRAVDISLVARNWLFGRYIVEFEQNGVDRAVYGQGLVNALVSRLKPLGIKGISATRLGLYRTFFQAYRTIGQTLPDSLDLPSSGIQPTLSDTFLQHFPLGWSHYVELRTLGDPDERRFYEIEAAENQWSVRELQRQIASSLYQQITHELEGGRPR